LSEEIIYTILESITDMKRDIETSLLIVPLLLRELKKEILLLSDNADLLARLSDSTS
jgi:hypothetical protein